MAVTGQQQWHVSFCCLLDQGRIEKATLSFEFFKTTSWLVSLLIPTNADRVDLLFCNANSISDQIATGYPCASVACDASLWGNCSTNLAAVCWIGLQSLLTGSDNSLFVRESVQLGLLLLSMTVTVYHCLTNRCFISNKPALGTGFLGVLKAVPQPG